MSGAKRRLKSASGQCKLRVQETHTRDAIITDTEYPATIAYLAIGAEAWGDLLAAAPELAEALQQALSYLEARVGVGIYGSVVKHRVIEAARAALAKAAA